MNREFKIGLVSIIVIGLLILGINYLKGYNVFSKNIILHGLYEDIDGLQLGAPVSVSGFKVGSVTDIQLLNGTHNLFVSISIEEEISIPKRSILKIVNQDLMGTKGVKLIFSEDNKLVVSGDTLVASIEGSLQEEVNAQILPFKRKAEELIVSIDSVMMIITAVLNKDARRDLSNSIESLGETFELMSSSMKKVDQIIEDNDERISNIIYNLEKISTNIEHSNTDVQRILTNLVSISDSLSSANITTVINNFNQLMQQINSDKGNIGLFINDDQIYYNLEKSTKELANLIQDIKDNPRRYINFSILKRSSSSSKE